MNTLVDHKVSRETLREALGVLGIPGENTVEVVIGMTSIEVTRHYLDSDGHMVVDYDANCTVKSTYIIPIEGA